MPSQFTSQIKIVPDQEQQHISVGLESLSRNLTKIQALKDLDDQAKMAQFNKLVDVSLEDFWQRDKDELYQGEQDYLASVAQAYKDYGKEGILPYQYQSKLDKEKSELMMKLEQSKADAEWYKSYMKQVAWDKTGRVDIEESTRPLREWMKLSISERAKIDKSQWFKLKAEEINLQKEIGDRANKYLKKSKSKTVTYDDEGNPIETTTWEGVTKAGKVKFVNELIADPDVGPVLKDIYNGSADLQKEFPIYSDYVASRVPEMGTQYLKTPYTKGKKSGYSPYVPDESGRYSNFPTTDNMRSIPSDLSSKEGDVTSLTTIPVQENYTEKGKAYKIESVKVLPTTVKGTVWKFPGMKKTAPRIFLGIKETTPKKKAGAFIFDDELTDNADNMVYKPYVIVSYTKEIITKKAEREWEKDEVKKKKIYKAIPYDDDVKSFLIKSKKFGKEADDYIQGILKQAGGVSVQQKQTQQSTGKTTKKNSNTAGSYTQD